MSSESFGSCESSGEHPFKIIEAGENPAKVIVLYGSVNNEVPDEVNEDRDSATEFTVTDGDKLILDITINSGGDVSDVEVKKGTVSNPSATSADVLIGAVAVNSDGKITGIGQSLRSSLTVFSCGDKHFFSGV